MAEPVLQHTYPFIDKQYFVVDSLFYIPMYVILSKMNKIIDHL